MAVDRSYKGLPPDRVRKFCGLGKGAPLSESRLIAAGVWWWRQIPEIYKARSMLARYWQTFGDPELASTVHAMENGAWRYLMPFPIACEFCHSDGRLKAWIDEWLAVEVRAREIGSKAWEPACLNLPKHGVRVPVLRDGTAAENCAARDVFLFEADLSKSDSVLVEDFRAWLNEERRRNRRVTSAGGQDERWLRGWLNPPQAGRRKCSENYSPFRAIELVDRKTLLGQSVDNDEMAAVRSLFRRTRRLRHE